MYKVYQIKLSKEVIDYVNSNDRGHLGGEEKYPIYETRMRLQHGRNIEERFNNTDFQHFTHVCSVKKDAGLVDGDGTNDLVTIGDTGSFLRNGDSSPVLALREGGTSCDCLGDADCNGSVDIEDLLTVLSNYGCQGSCSADVNGDFVVDIEDLLIVISGWNDCG